MTVRNLPGFRAHALPDGEPSAVAARNVRAGHDWYSIEAKGKSATIRVYDEIGFWGTTAADFARELADLDVDTLKLRLNSPGGSVFDGEAIYNALVSHRATVDVTVDGIAASIASVIAMAGDTVTMGRGTRMMIHNPSGLVLGQAKDMRKTADILDMLAADIAGIYAHRAGGSVDQWLASMDQEVWFSAQEAVDAGLADAVLGPPPADEAKNKGRTFDLTAYGFRYAGREHAPDPGAAARKSRSDAVKARVRETLGGVESK